MSDIRKLRLAGPCILTLLGIAVAGCGDDAVVAPVNRAPAALAFITQPDEAVAGEIFATAIRVEVRDAAGDRVPDAELPVTLAVAADPDGATLLGTTTVTSTNGVAVFSGLSLVKAATDHTLLATAGDLAPATSAPFAIAPADPVQIGLLAQPGTAEGQVPSDPAIEVAIQDEFENTVPDAQAEVTLALSVSPSGESLGGTTTRPTVDGVAVFSDLSLALPGDGFVLEASSDGFAPVAGTGFSVRTTFVQASVGNSHTCAVTAGDFAYCWGSNGDGRLGNGQTEGSTTPTPVAGGLNFTRVSAGTGHTCGLSTDGAVYCWGFNSDGRVGDGSTIDRDTPTPVASALTFASVRVGVHSCGITTDGDTYCWGSNFTGQLGNGTTDQREAPTLVAGGVSFASVIPGSSHTCGITMDGTAYCWGTNSDGRLGDGTTEQRLMPTAVAGDLSFAEISVGEIHTCGVTTEGDAYCWGLNFNGRLGDGTTENRSTPTPVAGDLIFARVDGWTHSCGITTDDDAYCWGSNFSGQLGDGTTEERLTPTAVSGGLSFGRITAVFDHTCGITTDVTAYCWGSNTGGRLGNGTTEDSWTPTRVVQ